MFQFLPQVFLFMTKATYKRKPLIRLVVPGLESMMVTQRQQVEGMAAVAEAHILNDTHKVERVQ